jgi:hypothetical protein
MKTVHGRALVLLLMAGFFAGCDDEVTSPKPTPSPYASPTEPESLITNLQLSYRRREIQEYAKLLASDYKFRFQPIDANDIGTQFWTRDQDSTGTRALLTTPEVSDIRLNLIPGARDLTVDATPPVDSLRIRIVTTDLQVDQTDGTTWVVTDQQDFYFRLGKAAQGEDPTHWLIYEWDDLPTLAAPRLLLDPAIHGSTTWGKIKSKYNLTEDAAAALKGQTATWGMIKSRYSPTLQSNALQVRSSTWGRVKSTYVRTLNSAQGRQGEPVTWGKMKTLYTK